MKKSVTIKQKYNFKKYVDASKFKTSTYTNTN